MEKRAKEETGAHKTLMLSVALLSAFAGTMFGGASMFALIGTPATAHALRESDIATETTTYRFTDPLIGLDGPDESADYADLKAAVSDYLSRNDGNLTNASIYFRDINEPGGFTVNPDERYHAASLFKVPVMMAYFKIAEDDPGILDDELIYTGSPDLNSVEEIKPARSLAAGASYAVKDLIGRMIRYSDNNALGLLIAHLEAVGKYPDYLMVFSDLGIDPASLTSTPDNVTVKDFSIMLRALYNATYLNRDDSERALELLSEADFSEGIDSGVPNRIQVAQKFGESSIEAPDGSVASKELNDCGIIYYPSHPYLLCIMTRGNGDDTKGLEEAIATVSGMVFKDVQAKYPETDIHR